MSCGRVDRYGRFHSELLTSSDCGDSVSAGAQLDDVNTMSSPARFLSRFSNRRNKHQEEEEALQMAMMILDDVNSLTSEGAAAAGVGRS